MEITRGNARYDDYTVVVLADETAGIILYGEKFVAFECRYMVAIGEFTDNNEISAFKTTVVRHDELRSTGIILKYETVYGRSKWEEKINAI